METPEAVVAPEFDVERAASTECRDFCPDEGDATYILTTAMEVAFILEVCLYFLYALWGLYKLKREPYLSYRTSNIAIRLLICRRLAIAAAHLLSAGLLHVWMRRANNCALFNFSRQGVLPLEFLNAGYVCVLTWAYLPILPRKGSASERYLQQITWTEGQRDEKQAAIKGIPLYCFETCVKLLYWSKLVYSFKKVPDDVYCIDTAMELFDLWHYEMLWDEKLETKAIIGWGDKRIVIVFRGTDCKKNALTDVKAWTVPHPPHRCHWWLFTRPRVHCGFLHAWHGSTVHQALLDKVQSIVKEQGGTEGFRVSITGHSLGGALASLASYDVYNVMKDMEAASGDVETGQQRCYHSTSLIKDIAGVALETATAGRDAVTKAGGKGVAALRHAFTLEGSFAAKRPLGNSTFAMSVYTYGCPRVGNHAFAHEMSELIPDTWHIINDRDIVAREGKLVKMCKRHGERTLINANGDVIVRPSYLEYDILYALGRPSPSDHMLAAYCAACTNFIKGQYKRKELFNGRHEIRCMVQHPRMEFVMSNMLEVDMPSLNKLAEEHSFKSHDFDMRVKMKKALVMKSRCRGSDTIPSSGVSASSRVQSSMIETETEDDMGTTEAADELSTDQTTPRTAQTANRD